MPKNPMPESQKRALLVDPELVLPREGDEIDLLFWDRMISVTEFRELLRFGPETIERLEDWLVEWYDEICVVIGNKKGNPDIEYVINDLLTISVMQERNGKQRPAIVDNRLYHPVLGRESSLTTLQHDLDTTHLARIMVDRGSWSGFGNRATCETHSFFLVSYNAGAKSIYRELLRKWPSYAAIQELATKAFPDLCFCDETWDHKHRIRTEEREYSTKIVDCLSVLNDDCLDVWCTTTLVDERKRRAKSGCKVWDVGPEKDDTMKRPSCRKDRTFHYKKEKLNPMEWHYKFRGNTGRMYFAVDLDKRCVYVGLITDHLDTA